ncbi:hypothetical protein BBD42_15610 [Paenibacillus sp. BIHB 4019]|uniref:Uncharacterized protein n=1 Tax=Paenibacillus sp. BIHB 4019 TaxID=1870819 RepID=A0A1B2DJ58_9BACL|nr:hypothetical protein [Paenibacillus sp. BIHB 4019]ANY67733.1 hypothetical protein BBD42_15610 [Paenibacillus sp. BIHB 4019]
MAILPLKQTVTITKAGVSDGWGRTAAAEVITLKARVEETTKVVTNQAGEEAVADMRILLDKLAAIAYDDVITYVNELGVTIERRPIKIRPIRMFSGRAILTEVYV